MDLDAAERIEKHVACLSDFQDMTLHNHHDGKIRLGRTGILPLGCIRIPVKYQYRR